MSKKLILVLAAVVFLFSFNLARAEVVINEIAWKGTVTGSTHEWLELHNTSAPINISGWTIKDGANQLNIIIPDGATIGNDGFYVIKRTTSDITPYDLSVSFDGGLSDSGEKLVLADATGVSKQVLDFSGGWPDTTMTSDKTMQWTGSSWIAATPTPGAVNQAGTTASTAIISGGGLVSSGSSDTSNATTTTSTKNKIAEESKIKTQITGKTFGFVGIPIYLQGTAFGLSGEQLHFGKYFWNFGDGDSKEMDLIDASQPLNHTYFYPGDYVVSLDYFQNHYSNVPDASNQITIKIVPADITISRVGDEKDFFIELSNNTDYNTDLSSWILASDTKSFTIPHNTILSAKKKIIISPKITGFSIADKNTLKLMNGEGKIVFDYGKTQQGEFLLEITPSVPTPKEEVVVSSSPDKGRLGGIVSKIQPPISPLAGGLKDATLASAVSSDIIPKKSSFPYMPIILVVFIGASAYGVYFIRQKRIVPQSGSGSDFEVLDE